MWHTTQFEKISKNIFLPVLYIGSGASTGIDSQGTRQYYIKIVITRVNNSNYSDSPGQPRLGRTSSINKNIKTTKILQPASALDRRVFMLGTREREKRKVKSYSFKIFNQITHYCLINKLIKITLQIPTAIRQQILNISRKALFYVRGTKGSREYCSGQWSDQLCSNTGKISSIELGIINLPGFILISSLLFSTICTLLWQLQLSLLTLDFSHPFSTMTWGQKLFAPAVF